MTPKRIGISAAAVIVVIGMVVVLMSHDAGRVRMPADDAATVLDHLQMVRSLRKVETLPSGKGTALIGVTRNARGDEMQFGLFVDASMTHRQMQAMVPAAETIAGGANWSLYTEYGLRTSAAERDGQASMALDLELALRRLTPGDPFRP